jgi:xylan 1,4-beta-xylosidase
VKALLGFLAASDTDGDGVPDRGVANTLDDGSPAIQFGTVQTYLAVKTLAALVMGGRLLERMGCPQASVDGQIKRLRATLAAHSWNEDHFNVLLRRSGRIQNPWNHTEEDCAEIPGWDAAHIYTANTLPLLDMVGVQLGLDEEQVQADLVTGMRRCLRRYGCIHSSFVPSSGEGLQVREGLTGASNDPGWISMNLVRDLAALRRGLDFRHLAERYWDWQLVTNTQGAYLFFETFNGNNLHHYPRGVVAWGVFDAVAGVTYRHDKFTQRNALPGVRVPVLATADWQNGRVAYADGLGDMSPTW